MATLPVTSGGTSAPASSGSGGAVIAYAYVKYLASGTFTTGSSADWRTQFSSANAYCPLSTMAGEIFVPGVQTTYGIYAVYGVTFYNPATLQMLVLEADGTHPVQVYLNGALISEVTSPGLVSLPFREGFNALEVVRAISPLIVCPSGTFIDTKTGTSSWASIFAQGEDPFSSSPSLTHMSGAFTT